MNKLLGILVLSLLICSSNFTDVKSSELVNTIILKLANKLATKEINQIVNIDTF